MISLLKAAKIPFFLFMAFRPAIASVDGNVPESLGDPFPTQILSAYNSRASASRWPANGAKVNDNEEVRRHFQQYISTTTQNYNIGVIQVKLSNWTDYPLSVPTTRVPVTQSTNSRRRQSRLRSRAQGDHWRPLSTEESGETSSTYIFQTGNPKDKYAHVDSTYAYVLVAIFLGLLLFLTMLYLFISCRSFCKKRSRRRQPVTFPSPYAYYESSPWGNDQRGGDLERLFRSDLETKRPPLVAPPPPPPRVPPPPIPQHLRPHPTYTRRKFIPPPPIRDSPVEREIRLQMLKRQISESTLSTRTRTNSF